MAPARTPVIPDHPRLLPSALLGDAGLRGDHPRRSARDWVIDVIAFLVALGGGIAIFVSTPDRESQSPALLIADLVLGVALCLALWWRRRWPVHLAVVSIPLMAFSAMAQIALAIVFFTVAVHRRALIVAIIGGISFPMAALYSVVRPDPSLPLVGALLLQLLFVAVLAGWGMLVRARRQLVVSLRERAERAEAEQHLRIEQARHLERTRIAREMHDVLAHRISLVSLHAGALEFRSDATPEEVARSAAVIRESAHQALQDLREILGVLRAEVADAGVELPQPTLADVARLLEESREAGMKVSGGVAIDDEATVPASIGRTAYRVVQEGLTNAGKHAPGASVTVSVSGAPGAGLSVDVRNPWPVGVAAASAIPGAGHGLTGLAERTAIAGGRLYYGRTPEGDFRLTAWLPWPGPTREPGTA